MKLKFRAWDTDTKQFVDCANHTIAQIGNDYAGLGNRFIYQQFTGLLDKDGKERCEGDIIRRNTGYIFKEEIQKFSLGSIHFATAVGYNYHPSDEIIGNIFENPELIKS